MKTVRMLGRILVPASLVLLAACQSMPGKKTTAVQSTEPSATQAAVQPETSMQASSAGAPVAIYLADTTAQTGWTPVPVSSGTLYVNPQPVVTRNDLTGVKAGTNKEGEGLIALALNDAGKKKIVDITTKNPNKRLALVVGRTMMAAPSYTTTITTEQLVFAVGTEQNATAAARAIAGVSAPEPGTQPQTQTQPQSPAAPKTPLR